MATKTENEPAATTPDAPPADVTPLMVKTVVIVKATVPLVQYGNLEMFVSQEIYTRADEADSMLTVLTTAMLTHLRELLADQVEPMAEADIVAARAVLLKEASPDTWMQRQNSVYRWLRVASPDRRLQAMEAIIHDEDRIAMLNHNNKY